MKNIIAELRKDNAWSQEKLAELLGVSRQTIISIEKGRFDPSLPLAFDIAHIFNRRIEEIFTREENNGKK